MPDHDTRRGLVAQLAAANQAPDAETPPTVQTPIDASQSELTVAARNFIYQAILVAGALVALLGLPATSWLARWVVFLKSEEAVPLIALAASLAASGRLLWRAVKKHRERQVMSLLLPESIAKSPEKPAAAVVAAAEAATVKLDQQGAAPAPPAPTKGL